MNTTDTGGYHRPSGARRHFRESALRPNGSGSAHSTQSGVDLGKPPPLKLRDHDISTRMPEHNSRKPECRFKVLVLLNLFLLAGCGVQRRAEYIVLSYSERSTFCLGCPNFRVELRSGGHVNLFGLSGCAIPGEYHFLVPQAPFSALLR